MKLREEQVRGWTESTDGKWAILRLREPVEVECSNPDCGKVHTATVLLIDRPLNGFVPFTTVRDAKWHVADIDGTVEWCEEQRTK